MPCGLKRQMIVDAALDLTGADVEDCVFDGCVLTLQTARGLRFVDSLLKECQLVGDGWRELESHPGFSARGGPG